MGEIATILGSTPQHTKAEHDLARVNTHLLHLRREYRNEMAANPAGEQRQQAQKERLTGIASEIRELEAQVEGLEAAVAADFETGRA